MQLISEHTESTRTSLVYQLSGDQYEVLTRDSSDNYSRARFFSSVDLAEDFAEDFVKTARVLL